MFCKKDKQVKCTPSKHKSGFDNPLSNSEDDKLNRKRFTNQIYSYLTKLDPDWSVRVGLLAPWGEGKTTVCRWISKKAEEDGHIPVFFNPWAATTDSAIRGAFNSALMSALEEYGIHINLSKKNRTQWGSSFIIKYWVLRRLNQKITGTFSNTHQYAKASLNVFHELTKMNDKDIQRLNKYMGEKRFIIIVDDLDRVDPVLIPRFLMTLRDIFDLEHFSFLLPFDNKIISDALAEYNKSDGFGENFLEKILDFRVHLNTSPKDQILIFFKQEMKSHCSFVPLGMLEGLDIYLPTNPRKLKSLVRGIQAFKEVAARHKEDEIDWKALIFAEMIRTESELFFDKYVEMTFNDSGKMPWSSAAIEEDAAKTETDEKERIDKLLKATNVISPEKIERLLKLCEGWRVSYGVFGQHKIKYALKLLSQPETITWAEFDSFWASWSKENDFAALSLWFTKHARQIGKPKDEVVREILITLTQQYDLHLEKASSQVLRKDQEACVEKAREILILFNCFMEDDCPDIPQVKILALDVFKQAITVIVKWFHFNGNESDRDLRKEEKSLLKKWVKKAQDLGHAPEYHAFLTNLRKELFTFKEDRDPLYRELLKIITPVIENAAQEALKNEKGISGISPDGVGEEIKKILLDGSSTIWTPQGDSNGEEILLTAKSSSTVQINALNFLDLLRKATNQGTRNLLPEEVLEFYNHSSLVVAIWNAATASELQYRRLINTRKIRDFLISKAIPADQLAMPDWLKEEKAAAQQTP